MSALLDNGLEVTALHNHFFWENFRICYMHIHGGLESFTHYCAQHTGTIFV